MAEAVGSSIAEALLEKLGSIALEEIPAAWGFKDDLEKLKDTVNTINDLLYDAEKKQVESRAVQGWLKRLKSVLYDADDLFDEFSTMLMRKELMTGSTLSKKVCRFFPSSNQPAFAVKMARQVKEIRGRLDAIAEVGKKYGFRQIHGNDIGQALLSLGSRETYSSVDAEVIGREKDREAIVKMLMLDPNDGENISIVSIVGIGGLGKTSLAKLVYNDEKIEKHFELRLWVCVGDDVFGIKEVIGKILSKKPDDVPIGELQKQLCGIIDGKKYLMVLDDVWIEDRKKWLELKNLLKGGNMGSKILITTRSWEVVKVAGTTTPYELKGLSEKKSWLLFERMAFEPGQRQLYPNLVEMGKEIVKKCANVPLAIKTLGCHLYGKEERVWLLLKDNELPKIPEGGDKIMAILKIRYHHLPSPLKNCFAYCSLYPKDYKMEKETLISLWMAQGFIIPSLESQSLEDDGEMYFQNLLQRCFFQDIERDEWGDIEWCKMHDLMHDVARDVAGSETIVAKSRMRFIYKKARHLSFDYSLSEVPTSCFKLKSLRTFLLPEQVSKEGQLSKSTYHQIDFSRFSSCLRVLDLHNLRIESLASSIGDLVQLRYLDLSWTQIKNLPASITKLENLQTLKLVYCRELEILPTDIEKLINLRHLYMSGCRSLTCMPAGIGTLTNLHKLDYFLVGSKCSAANSRPMAAQLGYLNALDQLRGKLYVKILGELRDPANEAKEANLRSQCIGLTELHIEWDRDDGVALDDEVALDFLQLHGNLRKLKIEWYRGQWLRSFMDNWNPTPRYLVEVSLYNWKWCQNVPGFHRLPSLKRLYLKNLESVEYMDSSNYKPASSTLFFPSLEELTLDGMHELKGWWNMKVEAESSSASEETTAVLSSTTSIERRQQHYKQMPSFPTLERLNIKYCPNLKSMPLCPKVEELKLVGVNKELVVLTSMGSPKEDSTAASSSSSSFQSASGLLKSLILDDVDNILPLLQAGCLQNLPSLTIQDRRLPDLLALGDVFRSLSSLQSLQIQNCYGLTSLSGGLEHLRSLESMEICTCVQLDLWNTVDMPWKALKGLRSLKLSMIPKMLELPDGLQHLTTLRSLEISWNEELIGLPGWIGCLTSLEFLVIRGCHVVESLPEGFQLLKSLQDLKIECCSEVLTERCKRHGGDWPKIRHIPRISC